MEPITLDGMDHADPHDGLPAGERGRDAREVVLDVAVLGVPRRLIVDRGGVVALGFALHRHPREVRDADGDAEGGLPVAVQLMATEIVVPAGHAVELAQHPLAPVLMHGGLRLFCRGELVAVLEHIDPGQPEGAVGAHRLPERAGLALEGRLVHHMPGQFQPVSFAPSPDLIGKRRRESLGDVVVVEIADPRNAFRQIPDQLGQMVEQRHAVGGAKGVLEVVRKGEQHVVVALCEGERGLARELRLVGEDRGDGIAEGFGQFPAIALVGHLDKAGDRLRVEGV